MKAIVLTLIILAGSQAYATPTDSRAPIGTTVVCNIQMGANDEFGNGVGSPESIQFEETIPLNSGRRTLQIPGHFPGLSIFAESSVGTSISIEHKMQMGSLDSGKPWIGTFEASGRIDSGLVVYSQQLKPDDRNSKALKLLSVVCSKK